VPLELCVALAAFLKAARGFPETLRADRGMRLPDGFSLFAD
jgi:hypothetical protein